ncbi:hypothetical protein DRE_00426 [Drechslerella stenobrocha 248]|uniref:Uncharacterized protein n=1 Tax=Drechslerella stenobrocha 248 TaxID=1043628 RepID=W7I5M3_9PEZI|nr:hypothetical protein DRE_00426 [Drechslerella stenobrocha 248]
MSRLVNQTQPRIAEYAGSAPAPAQLPNRLPGSQMAPRWSDFGGARGYTGREPMA